MSDNFIYDDVPYPSFTFPQTHPDRLATIAKLHGMTPANVETCRVLELGCGDGSNLNWISHTIPNGKFVGVDLSAKHISDAKLNAKELNLKNVEFHALDVLTLSAETFGKFDFIIAHGLFSWVPDFVREKILQIYRELLEPNGIGYLSYNAYPGCHLRDFTRNIMRFHAKDIAEPMQQVEESLKFLEFLSDTGEIGDKPSINQEIIKQEYLNLSKRTRENVFHDDLSEINQPFYFADFIAKAQENSLQFLSEAEFFSTQTQHFPQKVQEMFERFGDDIIKTEQYIDFFKSRRFRQTLLCHQEINIKRKLEPQIVRDFLIASSVECESKKPKLSGKEVETFHGLKNTTFQMNHPLTKAALFYLSKMLSKAVSFNELIEKSVELLKDEKDADSAENIEITCEMLLKLFAANFVKLHIFQPEMVVQINQKPLVSKFSRWQAKRGDSISNIRGVSFTLENDFVRALLLLLDGTNDKKAIINALNKNPQTKNNKNLPLLMEKHLSQIAINSLLVA